MAAAIPVAIMAWQAYEGHKAAKRARKAQQAGQQAQAGLQAQSTALGQQGAGMVRQGQAALSPALDYYRGVLGNQSQLRTAMAPAQATVLDYYKGAEGKAQRTLTGGSRDYALAELDREKVGNLAMMPAQARADAARGISELGGQYFGAGTTLTGQGIYGATGAGQAANQLFNQEFLQGQAQGEQASQWGKIAGDLFQGYLDSKNKGTLGQGSLTNQSPSYFPQGTSTWYGGYNHWLPRY